MRLIDADAAVESLTEYGNGRAVYIGVEEAVRRIEQLPSAQPNTTTHDSIPAKKGGNDEDRTSGDCISRTQAIDVVAKWIFEVFGIKESDGTATVFKRLRELPSVQPDTAKRIVGKSRDGMTLWYQCDMCNEPVDAQDNYCRGCGRRLIDG